MSQSYSTIINALNQFGDNHLSVKRFKTSFFDQFNSFSSDDNTFPILYAVPNDVSMDEYVDRYSFRIYCVDMLQKDRSNEAAILNDTLWVLRDLSNWLRISDNQLNILNNPRAIPVNNFLTEFTVGWYIDFEIEANAESNDCSIPFSENFIFSGYTCDFVYIQQYLTCETLDACQTIIDIQDEINESLTGGTYDTSTGTLSLVRNDGGIIPVTGFTTSSVQGDSYWTSGSTGTFSLKAINDTAIDATGNYALAEGKDTLASGDQSHAEGDNTTASGSKSHAEGDNTVASGNFGSHAEGSSTIASGETSHAEGTSTTASGLNSHSEGGATLASGEASHAEGDSTQAIGSASHAEGSLTTAQGIASHSEGASTVASGNYSHAEGTSTTASGDYSHAGGYFTTASGDYSHAGGQFSTAIGDDSFVHGSGSTAIGNGTVVLGSGITGTTDNTVFVPYLNIQSLSGGTSVNNLGIDANGYIVAGSGGTASDTYVTGFTYNNANTLSIKQNEGQSDLNVTINTVTGLTTNYFDFNTGATVTGQAARLTWNDADGTLDLGLKGGNVTLQIGQEEIIRVVNKTGSNLLESNYQAVRITGAQGNRIKIDLAKANNDANSAETIGLVTENINNNQEGFITTMGLVRGINTTGSLQGETWIDGDIIYLSPTTFGATTNIKPLAPQHTIIIGYVVQSNPSNGSIFVKVDNGYELDELHNVLVTGATDGQVLTYSAATSLWVATTPQPETFVTGFTYSPNTLTIKQNEGKPDLSVEITTMSALTITGGLTASTLNISTTPTLNNSVTQLLGRNETTGGVEFAVASNFLNTVSVSQIYGNGIDNTFVFDGTNAFSGVTTKIGNVYTLIRTIYSTNMTINSGVTLDTNGFAIYVKNTLVNNGTISANGNNGANGTTAGGATAGGVTRAPGASNAKITNTDAAGGVGGNSSTAGGNKTVNVNFIGGIGGSGGQGKPLTNTASTTTARGVVTVSANIFQQPYSNNYLGHSLFFGTIQAHTSWGGAGGQFGINGGGSLPGFGGGGGSTGFIVPIFANTLTMSGASSLIQSNGGAGGSGGTASGGSGTGGGGGGGGGGGVVYIISSTLNYTPSNKIQAKGGIGGAGGLGVGTVGGVSVAGVASVAGSNGVDGTIVLINPTTGTNVGYTAQI